MLADSAHIQQANAERHNRKQLQRGQPPVEPAYTMEHVDDALLEPGMTFCVEPGIYEPGAGAMKIEDMVIVTDDGCELLSTAPYDLEI